MSNFTVIYDTEDWVECPHCRGPINMKVQAEAPPLAPGYDYKPELSIVCITNGESHVMPFLLKMRHAADEIGAELVIGADGEEAMRLAQNVTNRIVTVKSKGYIESILNRVMAAAEGVWILRIDDDEEISPALLSWLKKKSYRSSPLWRIPTMALWENSDQFVVTKPLWPDVHLRLTTWQYRLGWDPKPHAPAPHHTDDIAPGAFLHYKYLLHDYDERKKVADHYESISSGAGHGIHKVFTLPEDVYQRLELMQVNDGSTDTKGEVTIWESPKRKRKLLRFGK